MFLFGDLLNKKARASGTVWHAGKKWDKRGRPNAMADGIGSSEQASASCPVEVELLPVADDDVPPHTVAEVAEALRAILVSPYLNTVGAQLHVVPA